MRVKRFEPVNARFLKHVDDTLKTYPMPETAMPTPPKSDK